MVSSPGGGDTKGPVCPCLAHALHSHTLSSPGEEGPGRKGAFLLGRSLGCPSQPLYQPQLELLGAQSPLNLCSAPGTWGLLDGERAGPGGARVGGSSVQRTGPSADALSGRKNSCSSAARGGADSRWS